MEAYKYVRLLPAMPLIDKEEPLLSEKLLQLAHLWHCKTGRRHGGVPRSHHAVRNWMQYYSPAPYPTILRVAWFAEAKRLG